MRVSATDQREGMGLLEYQSVPSLCDIAHDGVLSKAFFCATKKIRHFYRFYERCDTSLKIDTIQLLLYSKCTQPSVMSFVTQGRHGLVL